MTPQTVHYDLAADLTRQRTSTLDAAYKRNPNRFKGVVPQPPPAPTAVWINPPIKEPTSTTNTESRTVITDHSVSQSH